MKENEGMGKMRIRSSAIIAAMLGLAFSLGLELNTSEGLGFSWGTRALYFAAFATIGFLTAMGMEWLGGKTGELKPAKAPRFWMLWMLFFASAVPALIAYCPGIVAYDATAQILQGIDSTYQNNHPLLHTLLLSGCVRLGKWLFSYTLGAGLYSLVQMAIMAALFARCVQVLARLGVSRRAQAGVVLFYALYPVHAIMMISTTKDTLFAGFTALFLLRTIEALRMGKAFFGCRRKVIAYVALAAMTCLWRNNGIISLGVMGIVAVAACRGMRVRMAALFVGSVLAYVGATGALIAACSATSGSSLEILGVPIQQVARVARYHADDLPKDLAQEIEVFMPLGEKNRYSSKLVDSVKLNLRKAGVVEREQRRFLKLWWELGKLYPQEYLDAAILLNQGVWNPLDTTHASVYEVWEASQHGYLQTRFQRHIDNDRDMHIGHKPLSPWLFELYERFCTDNVQLKNPVVRIFFAPAGMALLCMCAMIRFAVRRRKAEAVAVSFLAALMLSQLLGPCALVRYAYPFFTCAPFLMALQGEKCIRDLA